MILMWRGDATAMAAGRGRGVAAASETMAVIKDGVGILPLLVETLGRPAFIAALITVAAALAIWFWRRQRLVEQGV